MVAVKSGRKVAISDEKQVRSLHSGKKPNPFANMSRVVSVESPDSRDGCITTLAKTLAGFDHFREQGIEGGGPLLGGMQSAQSPMDALRMGMASPLRSFLGLLKPPVVPGSSLHGSEDSPRGSNLSATEIENLCLKLTLGAVAEKETSGEMSGRGEGQSVVMVAFDANVREVSHSGIVWAMEHVLKRGDTLAVLSVLDTVRGPLGYRVKVGDHKWLSANQKLVEDEIQHTMEVWRRFPGLENRCAEGGVKLVVTVKAAQRGELAVCKEAVALNACHVVLDRSLKNRRREFYFQNLACDVTRMRRSGGVDVIRPSLDMTMAISLTTSPTTEPRSPTSVIPRSSPLSYGDQIDVFEISLAVPKPKRAKNLLAPKPSPVSSSPKTSEENNSSRLPNSATLSSAYEQSSSMSVSAGAHARSSSASTPSVQASLTSSSTATDRDMDDDLFSIFHGSNRHSEIDTESFRPSMSGYESDDLFSIGNASARRTSPAPVEFHHSHSQSLSHVQSHGHSNSHSQPLGHYRAPDAATPMSELVVSEPLCEATISRVTFVVGLGEAVTLSLREPLRPGEGLLVGSSPSALFLLQYGDGQSAATVSTATPGSYIAMEGKMAMKLAFLEAEQRVLAVDSLGRCRTIAVAHGGTAATPLVLVEAQSEGRRHSAMLQHSDGVGLCHSHIHSHPGTLVSVASLKPGDRVLLRLRSAQPSHAIWSS